MPPTFVDLFCGAGGFTAGLKAAGLRHALGVDSDPAACETYAANHGEVLCCDVTRLTRQQLAARLGTGRAVDVLAASPPCQTFSQIALGNRGAEHPSDLLYMAVVRVARWLAPAVVVLENVPGFATKGEGRHMARLTRALERLGYTVAARVLNE